MARAKPPKEYPPEVQAVFDRLGGPAATARLLEIETSACTAWVRIPRKRARKLSEATGLPMHELLPDVWPRPCRCRKAA